MRYFTSLLSILLLYFLPTTSLAQKRVRRGQEDSVSIRVQTTARHTGLGYAPLEILDGTSVVGNIQVSCVLGNTHIVFQRNMYSFARPEDCKHILSHASVTDGCRSTLSFDRRQRSVKLLGSPCQAGPFGATLPRLPSDGDGRVFLNPNSGNPTPQQVFGSGGPFGIHNPVLNSLQKRPPTRRPTTR